MALPRHSSYHHLPFTPSPSRLQVPDVLRLHRRLTACFVLYSYWMSNSRSPTPTPSTFAPVNISPSSAPTTSRTQPHEKTPTPSIQRRAELSTPRLTGRPLSLRSLSPVTTGHVSRTVRSADSPPEQEPMTKRFRRESPQPRGRMGARSSPSSDSQDEMADTEMDGGRSQPTETLPLAVAPPKKKRTRTLTTPHQASVLHALLAQVPYFLFHMGLYSITNPISLVFQRRPCAKKWAVPSV